MTPRDLADRLLGADTQWSAVKLLLHAWRAGLPANPARNANDQRYELWATLEEEVVQYFSRPARESGDLSEADRRQLADWVTGAPLGVDAIDAVAWGVDVAGSPTFAAAWRDELCPHAQPAHVMGAGDLYPVPEAAWKLPDGVALASRPSALTRTAVDELPHVRVHRDPGIEVVANFAWEADLETIAAGLHTMAALHPNERLGELDLPPRHGQTVFPVRPKDPVAQEEKVLGLVRAALELRAGIVVLPELSTTPDIVARIASLLERADRHHLVVAGSYHDGAGPSARNLAVALVPERSDAMEQAKMIPFSSELGTERPWKEGIATEERATLTVYHADRFRFALLTCKDFLDATLAGTLDRLGVNVLCVPAMSEKTDTFLTRARQHVADAQAVTVAVNGPLRWDADALVEPVAVFGQPARGREAVVSPAGELAAGTLSVLKLGADAAEVEET